MNLFMLGDMENFGFEHECVEFRGDFNGANNIRAALLRFFEDFLFYARGDFDLSGVLEVMRQANPRRLAGKAGLIDVFAQHLDYDQRQELTITAMEGEPRIGNPALIERACLAARSDLPQIHELYSQIEEFKHTPSLEQMEQRFDTNAIRKIFKIEENGRIVSVAQSTAECAYGAMIVGVATLPEWRKRGYATACMAALCRALHDEGKRACLFYDNPSAGRIYHGLGFREFGRWLLLSRTESQ
ncbi:GNAT family N-acetyltransferase [Candidatus Sumerlaeota bacterium]|nr:GNAT family N-acetyltransferase [Candidatus Sumerlaeota bacterium]